MTWFVLASEAAEAAGEHGEHAAAGGASFPPFDPALFSSQLFWFAIAFGALFYVMKNIALPGVEETLSKRKNAIEADLSGAQSRRRSRRSGAGAARETSCRGAGQGTSGGR